MSPRAAPSPEETWTETLAAASDETKGARDEALLAYLAAYEEYTTCQVEMEAQLRQGHLSLTRARRDLSSRGGTIGPALFPREFDATMRLHADAGHSDVPVLRAELCEGNAERGVQGAVNNREKPAAIDADSVNIAALERMGVHGDLQAEILSAVRDDGDDVGMICGDTLAVERRHGNAEGTGVGASYKMRSTMNFSASGLEDLKHAQFRAALSTEAPDPGSTRPKPQARPDTSRDPTRWFSPLPPPSLRQAQSSFRRAVETVARCATAQAQMDAARRKYESLLPSQPTTPVVTD